MINPHPLSHAWTIFFWGVIGFAFGTAILTPLVLAIEHRDRVLGGMLFGGLPFGIAGLLYGTLKVLRTRTRV
jgi:hypothetical protein